MPSIGVIRRLTGMGLTIILMIAPAQAFMNPDRSLDSPASAPAAAPPAKGAPRPSEPRPEFPPFEEVMKDYELVSTAEPPFLTLWYNKKTDSLRAQLPGGFVGQKFLIATSLAGGPVATGFQLDHFLAYFDRMDKNLVLMRVDPRYVDGGDEPIADVIKRSYGSDVILRTVPIMTMKGSEPIIDLDEMCKSDFVGMSNWGMGAVNSQLSKWSAYKAFPQNVELTTDLAMMRGSIGRRMLVHYSISKVPESSQGYKARQADDRVGYFMTVRKDWTKPQDSPTLFDRYINRWHLEKRDPTAELSAPKNPIVWYIEKTVPLKYRRWVKEGILEWNKAFALCGFLDAVEVKQQEAYDPDTKDLDPEDVRYNFFRWIVTGMAFAMGPSRDHPLTGQIFDADIVFDDSMVRSYAMSYESLSGRDSNWRPTNPFVEQFFASHPQWSYQSTIERLLPGVRLREDPDQQFRQNLMKYMFKNGRPLCECSAGMAQQLSLANIALEAAGMGRNNDEFIGQIIKEIVMHEVGHCLGLRHNFKASTWLSMEEVEAHRESGEPNVGSVMDYNPPILASRDGKQGSYTTRSIGPYDYWAIEYGYRPMGKPYPSEEKMLAKIASRGAAEGLDYATDEDTMSFFSPDPYSNLYDMGRDVKKYAERQIALADGLLKDVTKWAVKDGESYSRLRRVFTRLLGERSRVCEYVARFVGGQIIHRDHRADPDFRDPIEVVSAEEQSKALEFVCDHVFSEEAYEVDRELLSRLGPGRYYHWGSDNFDFQTDVNIHDIVAENQYSCLFMLMNPFAILRIHDNQIKFGEDDGMYTLSHHIMRLTDRIWSELEKDDHKGSDREPLVNSFRRNLQRMHLNMLLNLVLTEPGGMIPADASAIARHSAGRLSDKIGHVLDNKDRLDDTSLAHLSDVKKRIDKALDAQYSLSLFSSMGGLGGLFFQTSDQRNSENAGMAVLPAQ
jgi:hypothetical protein